MNQYAAAYAIKKAHKEVEARIKSVKADIDLAHRDDLMMRPEETVKAEMLWLKNAGTYRVDFGGAWGNVLFDGKNGFMLYRPPREEQDDAGEEEKEEKYKLNDKQALARALELHPKASYSEILDALEDALPGLVSACSAGIEESFILKAIDGVKQKKTYATIFAEIKDPYYEKILLDADKMLSFSYGDFFDEMATFKKLERKISMLESYLVEFIKKSYTPNDLMLLSRSERISLDKARLAEFCEKRDPEEISRFFKKEEKREQAKTYAIGYAGRISEIGEGISDDLAEALSTMRSVSKISKAIENKEHFFINEEKNLQNPATGRLSR